MAEVDRQFIKVSEQMADLRREASHKVADLSSQILELRLETARLKAEIALLREAVQRQSLKEIPFKGTIS